MTTPVQGGKAKVPALGGLFLGLTIAVVALFGAATWTSSLLQGRSLAAVISAVLVDLANADRAVYAAQPLTVNPVLTAAAQAKADHMAAHSYFAHVSPDGRNSWYWFREAGYAFKFAGENLAVDFSDSIDVERAWMNSPTHRRNILDGNFTEIGIATAQGVYKGRRTTFVVQMFGTPTQTTAAAVPAVQSSTLPDEPTEPALATTEPEPEEAPAVAAATSAGAVAQVVSDPDVEVLGTEAVGLTNTRTATWWEHLLASPKQILQYSYYLIAAIAIALLAYHTEIEFHRRHTHHAAASAFLIVLMVGLFAIADAIFFSEPVIAAILR